MISCGIDFIVHPWEIVLNGSWVADIHGSSRLIKAVRGQIKMGVLDRFHAQFEIH